jgi:hypothetical protein
MIIAQFESKNLGKIHSQKFANVQCFAPLFLIVMPAHQLESFKEAPPAQTPKLAYPLVKINAFLD